jgi:hypothetical protein
MHAFMHRLRYQETGDYYDCCAANLLSGDWTAEQARQEACKHGQQLSEKFYLLSPRPSKSTTHDRLKSGLQTPKRRMLNKARKAKPKVVVLAAKCLSGTTG